MHAILVAGMAIKPAVVVGCWLWSICGAEELGFGWLRFRADGKPSPRRPPDFAGKILRNECKDFLRLNQWCILNPSVIGDWLSCDL